MDASGPAFLSFSGSSQVLESARAERKFGRRATMKLSLIKLSFDDLSAQASRDQGLFFRVH